MAEGWLLKEGATIVLGFEDTEEWNYVIITFLKVTFHDIHSEFKKTMSQALWGRGEGGEEEIRS